MQLFRMYNKAGRENGSGHSQQEKIFTVLFEMDLNWGRGARSDKCETSAVKPAMSEDSGAVQQSVKSWTAAFTLSFLGIFFGGGCFFFFSLGFFLLPKEWNVPAVKKL